MRCQCAERINTTRRESIRASRPKAPSTFPSKIPVANNYTLGIQQQLGRIAVMEVRYVGNHSYDQFQNLNGNAFINAAPPTSTVTAAQQYKTLAQGFPNLFPSSTYCTTPGAVGSRHAELQSDDAVASRQHRLQQLQRTADPVADSELSTVSPRTRHIPSAVPSITPMRSSIPRRRRYHRNLAKPLQYQPGRARRCRKLLPQRLHLSADGLQDPRLLRAERDSLGRLLGGYSVNTIWSYNSGQVYTPFQSSKAAPNAAATAKIPTANQGQALFSFCDFNYNTNSIGIDSCRPILSNQPRLSIQSASMAVPESAISTSAPALRLLRTPFTGSSTTSMRLRPAVHRTPA